MPKGGSSLSAGITTSTSRRRLGFCSMSRATGTNAGRHAVVTRERRSEQRCTACGCSRRHARARNRRGRADAPGDFTASESDRGRGQRITIPGGAHASFGVIARSRVIGLDRNRGIAAALNLGVRRLAAEGHDHTWVLTLDQDTLLHPGAINSLLGSLDLLDASTRDECGVVGMRHKPVEVPQGPWRWAERHVRVRDLGHSLRERRLLITSGNLVRSEVAETIPYEEPLFMDQVDDASAQL